MNNILSPGTPFDRSARRMEAVSDFDFTLDDVLLLRTVAEAYRELGQAMRADALVTIAEKAERVRSRMDCTSTLVVHGHGTLA